MRRTLSWMSGLRNCERVALAFCFVLCSCSMNQSLEGQEKLLSVTYHIGGFMSGPYRLSLDFVDHSISEATPPSGAAGDASGIKTKDLPVTNKFRIAQQDEESIRHLAFKVLESGPLASPSCPPQIDAITTLEFVTEKPFQPGYFVRTTRSFTLSIPCLSPYAKAMTENLSRISSQHRTNT